MIESTHAYLQILTAPSLGILVYSLSEFWLMIVGRVLAGFGFGVLAVRYIPQIANPLGVPTLLLGLVLVLIAAKGLFR